MAAFIGQFEVCSLLEPGRWKNLRIKNEHESEVNLLGVTDFFVSNPVYKPLCDCVCAFLALEFE